MKTRDQINQADQWKLSDIFANDAAWEQAFSAAQALANTFGQYAGTLGRSTDALFTVLTAQSALSLQVETLYAYAHMHKDEDNGNVRYQGMTDRAMQLYVSAGANSSFVVPEILEIPGDTLTQWATEPRFAPFRFMLVNLDRSRFHSRNAAEERLLAMAEEPLSGPDNIFTMLSDVDLSFGQVTDENGEKIELTHGSYSMLLQSRDRRVRREAYLGMYGAYRKFGNTVAATYTTSVKADVFRARAHNFPGALEAALFSGNVPVSVYDQLIEAVHEKLPALQKYLNLRREKLGLSQLEMYDLYVPIVPECEIAMSYEQSKALVSEALRPLGNAYQTLLDAAYHDGWIDVYETSGKTSGAFCSGVYGVHPYVLLNHQGRMEDAFTLAHELGHAMHSYRSDAAQPYETSQYSIMVAEVASTVNETLLTKHLLENEVDRKKRAYYLNHFLEQFRTTCFRQTMFAEFERKAHVMAESGEPLTVESLSEVYRALNKQYYAGVNVDDNIAAEWMRIPHFYNAYYVYQYATGLCAAVKLAEDLLEHGTVERYLTFLSSGGSDHPIELLRAAGVDLTDKRSILSALDLFEQSVDELAELL
ncbi:MAG: oligoendopeptidase F [Clostridia bacterium]